jgi:hypothetical protein
VPLPTVFEVEISQASPSNEAGLVCKHDELSPVARSESRHGSADVCPCRRRQTRVVRRFLRYRALRPSRVPPAWAEVLSGPLEQFKRPASGWPWRGCQGVSFMATVSVRLAAAGVVAHESRMGLLRRE